MDFARQLQLILLTSVLIGFCACKSEKEETNAIETEVTTMPFDKKSWNTTDGSDYLYREKMMPDLFKDDKLKGLTAAQIEEILGPPTRTDKNYLFYELSRGRIMLFTVRTRTLVIRLSAEGLSEAVLVHGG